ncbi:MAG TPA: GGDEF-domain containing protein [Erythrobacter sp.]|uniref:EAL domain-containing protein n=1 Tax=Qipengyuania citrea TaxID=225971 RepID=A0A6I4UFS7_9SPHN|nr:GGDEF-domain containing protein [Erythrobacteraceae bacterium]MCD1591537.1 EAL domain-containing protein [Qipengyuania citrea]RZP20631.1 MAG: EAL domain-containing protein [Erythrobacter sp.]MXP36169.1 EAL domain-containing protein [Qipengyuania citrea]HAL90308.1 GGDEF-domain containing protein [Erythrobacter sp.]
MQTRRRDHDVVTLGIAFAAIILFVGTAGVVLPNLIEAWTGDNPSPDSALTNALLLNIALILLGWHRYKALTEELNSRRESEEEARRLADIDHLTGCQNRRSFTTALGDLLHDLERREEALAAIAVDLDNFKQVNDLHGHQAGDEVLRVTAGRIQRLLPEGGILARLGGDEFVCVVPYHPQVPDRVDQLATRMVENVARPVEYGDMPVDVTMSIGIASSTQMDNVRDGTAAAQTLMHKADIAMYHAKKQGKNRFYWFEPQMENELRFRNELEAGIRRGIVNGEFLPYYEQQIDLDSGKLVGFEMLARWESPEMGVVGPDIFIPIAEEIGVIGEMSEALITRAFEDAKKWDSDLSLSVNISPVQMRDPWFAQKLLKLLVRHNFPANRLDIEITESCLHENVGMVRSMISSLRNQGVKISLDDFGTGYSSLSQLRALPFDRIKIDRAFISELKQEEHGAKLVDAILTMSDGLNLPVTAEGIENEVVLETLKRMGKMKGQGYHYGRPEPAAKVLERLDQQNLLAKDRLDNVTEVDFTAQEHRPGGGKRAG